MGNKQNILKDKKAILLIAFIALAIIGAALVTVVPKMSIWSRSFTNESARYEYIEPGQSVSISFYAPFDRIDSVRIYMENFDDWDVVTATDADIILSDSEGNEVCSQHIASVFENEFSFGGIRLNRDVMYVLSYKLNSINGNADRVGVGVSQDGNIAIEMRGSYTGAPTKGMFIGCYVVIGFIVLAYIWFYGESVLKKTKIFDKVILAVGLFMAIMFINQFYDLFMTGKSGLRMLDAIMNGQYLHYYDYVYAKELLSGSSSLFFEYIYSVFTYSIVAILMIPFRFIANGDITFSSMGNILVLYFDVIVTLLVLWSVKLTERICDVCKMPEAYRTSVKYIYAFSSVLISVLIASGQIDIIYVIIMLWAMPFYYSGKYKTFSFVMAFALAVKLLPFMIFFPLILLVNKKIKDIVINTAICFSVTVFFKIIFDRGSGYEAISGHISDRYSYIDKLFDNRLGLTMSLFIIAYVAICIWCYLKNIDADNKKMLLFYSMLVMFVVYGFFTAFIEWHSQWLVPLILSFAYLVPFIVQKERVLIIECVLEALILLVSDSVCGAAYMVDNGLLALPEYPYQGISLTEAMSNVTPLAAPMLTSLQAAVIIGLIVYFAKADPFKKGADKAPSEDYAVDRSHAIGRIFVLYGLMLISLWQYSYVG